MVIPPRSRTSWSFGAALVPILCVLAVSGCSIFSSGEGPATESPAIAQAGSNGRTVSSEGNFFSRFGQRVIDFLGLTPPAKEFAQGEAVAEATRTFSREEEYYLGRAVAARIIAKYGLVSSAEFSEYLNTLGLSLVSFSEAPETFGGYHFAVLDTDSFNAVSAPGGFIFVSRGLIAQLKDEDELSAVLAHEINHITKRHGIRSISQDRMKGVLEAAGLLVGSVNCDVVLQQAAMVFGAAVDEIVDTLLEKGYSRDFEYEADSGAVALLAFAGLGPQGMTDVLEILQGDEARAASSAGGWLSTHPSAGDRRAALHLPSGFGDAVGEGAEFPGVESQSPLQSAVAQKEQRMTRFERARTHLQAQSAQG